MNIALLRSQFRTGEAFPVPSRQTYSTNADLTKPGSPSQFHLWIQQWDNAFRDFSKTAFENPSIHLHVRGDDAETLKLITELPLYLPDRHITRVPVHTYFTICVCPKNEIQTPILTPPLVVWITDLMLRQPGKFMLLGAECVNLEPALLEVGTLLNYLHPGRFVNREGGVPIHDCFKNSIFHFIAAAKHGYAGLYRCFSIDDLDAQLRRLHIELPGDNICVLDTLWIAVSQRKK